MAERRMFSLKIINTDRFLDMPQSSQNLYFHLGMRADDDGFVSSPKRIVKTVGSNEDDLRLLVSKGYIIPFESGVCVITNWKQNNYIQKDRYHKTIFTDEKALLGTSENGSYVLCIHDVSRMDTEASLGKVRLGKVSEGKDIGSPPAPTGDSDKPKSGKGKQKRKRSEAVPLPVPDEIKPQWDAWVDMREGKKKPLTDYAHNLALGELEKLAPGDYETQRRILDTSTLNGWTGLFPLKGGADNGAGANRVGGSGNNGNGKKEPDAGTVGDSTPKYGNYY